MRKSFFVRLPIKRPFRSITSAGTVIRFVLTRTMSFSSISGSGSGAVALFGVTVTVFEDGRRTGGGGGGSSGYWAWVVTTLTREIARAPTIILNRDWGSVDIETPDQLRTFSSLH